MVEQYQDTISMIRFHTRWPGTDDPFYQFNLDENEARINYYGIPGSSYLVVDGGLGGNYPLIWDSLFVSRMPVESPLEMTISGTYAPVERQADLDITVIATDTIDFSDLRFHCALTESRIHWLAPNGLPIHNQVMRDMVPDPDGESFSISLGDTVRFERTCVLDDTLNSDSCEFVVFVQSYDSCEVLQSALIRVPDLTPTGVDFGERQLPSTVTLDRPYPNPFNASTTIRYSLPQDCHVAIEIYDILGRLVMTLVDERQQAGFHQVKWDAPNNPSGIYFARVDAPGQTQARKMVLLK